MPIPHSSPLHEGRARWWVTLILAAVILVPCVVAFGSKFQKLIAVFQNSADGAFAITPIVNYILATLGFFCMLCWATYNGMFREMERPKHHFLDTEEELDRDMKR